MARVSKMLDMLLEVSLFVCFLVCLFTWYGTSEFWRVVFENKFGLIFKDWKALVVFQLNLHTHIYIPLHQSGYDPLLRPGQEGESTQVDLSENI